MGVILAVFGLIVTGAWLAMAAIYISAGIGFDNIMLMLPSELGQLLAGIFLPLVVLWLVLLFFQLGRRGYDSRPAPVAAPPIVQIQREPARITHDSLGRSLGRAIEGPAPEVPVDAAPADAAQDRSGETSHGMIRSGESGDRTRRRTWFSRSDDGTRDSIRSGRTRDGSREATQSGRPTDGAHEMTRSDRPADGHTEASQLDRLADSGPEASQPDRPPTPTDLPESVANAPLRPRGMATRAFVKRLKRQSRLRGGTAGASDDPDDEGMLTGAHAVIAARRAAQPHDGPSASSWGEAAAVGGHDAPAKAMGQSAATSIESPVEASDGSSQAAAPDNGARDAAAETGPETASDARPYAVSRARPYETGGVDKTPPLGFRHSVRIASLELNSVAMELIGALSRGAVHDKALKDYDNGQKEIFFDLLLSHLTDREAKDVARDLAVSGADHHLGSYAQIYENLIKESKRVDPHGGLAKSLDAMTIGRLYAKVQGVRAAAGQLAAPARA